MAAAAIQHQQLQIAGSVEQPPFFHLHGSVCSHAIISKESLWVDTRHLWAAAEERTVVGFALSIQAQGADLPSQKSTRRQNDVASLVSLLRACTKNKDLATGSLLHDTIVKRSLLEPCSDALATMYAKCGSLANAKALLDMHKSRDVISWTALIAGYVRQGRSRDALSCFECMQHESISPSAVTYACILKACGIVGAIDMGEEIHQEINGKGMLQNDDVLGTALVDMYAKCGALAKAQAVLEKLPFRDVFSWSALICGYAQHGQGEQALICFEHMKCEGVPPNAVTYACILRACGTLRAIEKGKQIHDAIAKAGLLQKNIVLGNALVDMYVKCGTLARAHHVLEELPSRDVHSWSALIAGYAQQGKGEQALDCFELMQREGIPPNAVTYGCILNACGSIGAIERGEQIHDAIVRGGLLQDNAVLGNALVDMYAKCGAMAKARHVLEELPSRNVVSWSTLIAGYVQHGQGEQAIISFEKMQWEGVTPDEVTYVCILNACGTIGAIDKGKGIHDKILGEVSLRDKLVLGNALVDMYAKCGDVKRALCVLEDLPTRNVVSWNALIAGYVQQGQGDQALNCFRRMQNEGILPDQVTFSSVLNACSHLGLVEEGHMFFMNMSTLYGVKPSLECYICMIDLFGRAGHLEKAVRLIQEMPSSDYPVIWVALLSACRNWGDVNVGRWAFEQIVKVDKRDGPAYVLLADILAAAGVQEKDYNIQAVVRESIAWNKPGSLNMFQCACS